MTHFLALKFDPEEREVKKGEEVAVVQLVRAYKRLFGLDQNPSILSKLSSIFYFDFVLFSNSVIYFSSGLSFVLLVVALLSYLILSSRLLMPRSFFHIYVNTWATSIGLLLVFTLGSAQIRIPHLCLLSAALSHYLTLSANAWYALFFYALFSKLDKLKRRNIKLILNEGVYLSSPISHDDQEEEEYVARPVVHLYMLGWGAPMLLCAAVISICKRDYVRAPFNLCFTNHNIILSVTLLAPVLLILLLILVFAGLASFTLRRIVQDLNKESDKLEKPRDEQEPYDKSDFCQRWTNEEEKRPSSLLYHSPPLPKQVDSRSISSTSQNSAQTSVMDTQHKPSTQLNLTVLSFVLLALAWLSGAGLLCSNSLAKHFSTTTGLLECLFSYLFSLFCLSYSFIQLSFYVLSRGDLFSSETTTRFNFTFWKRCLNKKRVKDDCKYEVPPSPPPLPENLIEKVKEESPCEATAPPEPQYTNENHTTTDKFSKKQHVRNGSILSGSNTAQVLGEYEAFNETNTMGSARKRPLYVFVDYKYEDKLLHKVKTSPSSSVVYKASMEVDIKSGETFEQIEKNVNINMNEMNELYPDLNHLVYSSLAHPFKHIYSPEPKALRLNDSGICNNLARSGDLELKQETSV